MKEYSICAADKLTTNWLESLW